MAIFTGVIVSLTAYYIFQIPAIYSVIFGVASSITFIMTILFSMYFYDHVITRDQEIDRESMLYPPGIGHEF